MGCYMGPCGLL